jgi:hypothetical protein
MLLSVSYENYVALAIVFVIISDCPIMLPSRVLDTGFAALACVKLLF